MVSVVAGAFAGTTAVRPFSIVKLSVECVACGKGELVEVVHRNNPIEVAYAEAFPEGIRIAKLPPEVLILFVLVDEHVVGVHIIVPGPGAPWR